jgi:hypothetical protein
LVTESIASLFNPLTQFTLLSSWNVRSMSCDTFLFLSISLSLSLSLSLRCIYFA